MKICLAVSALLILTITTAAQTARKAVVWSGDPGCGFRTKAFSADDKLACTSVNTERGPVSTISYNHISLSAAFLEDNEHLIVAIVIANRSDEPVLFDSDAWGAAHYRTRNDFIAESRPILAETSIPTREMIRSMATDTGLQNNLGDLLGQTSMTAETREMRKPDGTRYIVTTIVPDKDVQTSQASQNAARSQVLNAAQMRIRETALTAKSVPAHGSTKGVVYFRRMKKAGFVVFSFRVEDTVFVYALPRVKQS
ncbi:MAG: hypothetical protein JO314_10515 [Acidobacteria bacterium]|nr:hypothetical protein [Acidobacteriota bacterium]